MMANQLLAKWLAFVLLAPFACRTTATVFSEHPTDVTVTEGGDATFRCGTDLPCQFFYWGRYQASTGDFSYVSKCLSSYEPQHSVRREGSVYSLHVRDVGLRDSGTVYECWEYSQSNGGWLQSSNATLTVLPATSAWGPEPPVCRVDPPGPHGVGDTVSLECSYTPTAGQRQASGLSWMAGRRGSDFDSVAEKKPGKTHQVEWTLSAQDNFKQFICSTADPGSMVPSSGANCTVTPLAISTNAIVSPLGSQAVVEGGDAVFQCNARAVPEVTSYTWLVTKDGTTMELSQRFTINDDEVGRTLRIIGVSTGDDGIEVTCEAWNELNITGRSLPSVLRVFIRAASTEATYSSTGRTTKKQGKNSAKEPDDLTQWSHMALVIGIMLCIVVLFVAAGMGVMYAGWRRRVAEAAKDTSPATPSAPDDGETFALHNPEADLVIGDGCVRACAFRDGSPQLGGGVVPENLYTENVYMEILGNHQTHPKTPAPAHERAVENDPVYERHF